MPTPDFIRRLALKDGFTEEELEQAFRERVVLTHPDRGGSKEDFQQVQADYEAAQHVLTKRLPRKRAESEPFANVRDPILNYPSQTSGIGIRLITALAIGNAICLYILSLAVPASTPIALMLGVVAPAAGFACLGFAKLPVRFSTPGLVLLLAIAVGLSIAVSKDAMPEVELGTRIVVRICCVALSLCGLIGWIASLANHRF